MSNKISASEFNRLMDGIACAVTAVSYSYTNIEPDAVWVEATTRKIAIDYLDELGITEVEDEDEPDLSDDVDETNYDPYIGSDYFETYNCDEGW